MPISIHQNIVFMHKKYRDSNFRRKTKTKTNHCEAHVNYSDVKKSTKTL